MGKLANWPDILEVQTSTTTIDVLLMFVGAIDALTKQPEGERRNGCVGNDPFVLVKLYKSLCAHVHSRAAEQQKSKRSSIVLSSGAAPTGAESILPTDHRANDECSCRMATCPHRVRILSLQTDSTGDEGGEGELPGVRGKANRIVYHWLLLMGRLALFTRLVATTA